MILIRIINEILLIPELLIKNHFKTRIINQNSSIISELLKLELFITHC